MRPLTIPSFVPSLRYLVTAVLLLMTVAHSAFANMDTAEIEKLTGLKGTYSKEENVFKVSKPRTDVKIQVMNGQCLLSWAWAHGLLLRPPKTGRL